MICFKERMKKKYS